MRSMIGRSPVHPLWLAAGKAGAAVSCTVLALRLLGVDLLGVTVRAARLPALAVGILGSAMVVIALIRLRDAARVGLPGDAERTTLKTDGVYAFSRNPIYLGGLLVCLASCVYVPHWINIACTLLAAVVHHRIVLAEERFLDARFGEQWEAYRRRVRRY